MNAPDSPEAVCNLSLNLLRHSTKIVDLSDPQSEEEGLAAEWYDATRRACLRAFPWNFARKRAMISRVPVAPAFGYPDAYQLPNDYIGYVFVGDDQDSPLTDFVIEGDKLLIDNSGAASLGLCYVSNIDSVVKFDPIFLMLLVGELAVLFGNSLTGLNKSLAAMEKFRDRWEVKARAKNGHENPPKVRHNSPILDARRMGRRSTSSDGQHLFS